MKLSDDAISREAVIKDFTQWRGKMAYSVGEDYSGVSLLDRAIRVIKDMPPVTQKSGKWIVIDEGFSPYECSECGSIDFKNSKFCPNCGVRMESEE